MPIPPCAHEQTEFRPQKVYPLTPCRLESYPTYTYKLDTLGGTVPTDTCKLEGGFVCEFAGGRGTENDVHALTCTSPEAP
jgi:hypothetical protein